MTLRIVECDVVTLAREVLDSLGSLAESRVMSLRPEGDEFRASLDRGLIFRVIQNLVANALKFAPANDGLIAIGIGRAEDGVRINVTDNGPGIPIEHHGRIFEKFGQAGEKEAREVFSTGLGLSFCKLAVEAHGGRIGVESEVGKGSTFWFVLPGCLRPLAREEQTGQET
jgi:signal transduction histidine kinase